MVADRLAPGLRPAQTASSDPGDLSRSLNLFRGEVVLPLELVSLPGRNGLDVGIVPTYQSNVARQVALPNRDAPTGLLGVGWSLGLERIVIGDRLEGLPARQRYFLIGQAGPQPLYPVSTDDDGATRFQTREFHPWRIALEEDLDDPMASRWRVTREDGSVRVYGGPGATEAGARWDGWVGPSIRGGAERFPVAWHLASETSVEGDSLAYTYTLEEVDVGGVAVTRAVRPSTIVDVFGRRVEFAYAEKSEAEIEPPEVPPDGNPPACQFSFEKYYLEAITVRERDGTMAFRQRLGYTLLDVGAPTDAPRASYTKRYLTEARQERDDARRLPATTFTYNADPAALQRGALEKQVMSTGARSRYRYAPAAAAHSATALELQAPPDHRPQVWHGPDYTVVTWHRAGGGLRVQVCSWSGVWRHWIDEDLEERTVSDVEIHPGSDFFVLRYNDHATGLPGVRLYSEDPYRFGTWEVTPVRSGIR